jgi:hypothetical protein
MISKGDIVHTIVLISTFLISTFHFNLYNCKRASETAGIRGDECYVDLLYALTMTCEMSVVFSPGIAFSSPDKTDRYDINAILLRVALNTINPNPMLTANCRQTK